MSLLQCIALWVESSAINLGVYKSLAPGSFPPCSIIACGLSLLLNTNLVFPSRSNRQHTISCIICLGLSLPLILSTLRLSSTALWVQQHLIYNTFTARLIWLSQLILSVFLDDSAYLIWNDIESVLVLFFFSNK